MSGIIELQIKTICEEIGIAYVEPDAEGRQQMLDAISAHRQREYEESEKRRQAEEQSRIEKEAREDEERKLNSAHLTAKELTAIWMKKTPLRFRDADISKVGKSRQMTAIMDGASALILGSNGAGKTYMAYALSKAWSEMAHDAVVIKATEILGTIKGSPDPFKAIRDRYGRGIRHLVIDEIDKIFESKADFVYLNYLIDIRYEWVLQTVVLGNGTKDDFIGNLGQSIYSRLTGNGGVGIILNHADRRKEQK